MAELNEQVHIEDHTLAADGQDSSANEAPPQASIVEAFQHYACLYIKYIQILKRLADCYDQMVHPQKRIDVKQVMEVVTTRVVELKHDLVKWNPPNPDVATQPERSFPWEYVNLDDILVDLKLPPETLEIPVPKSFVEDHAEELLRRERLVKGYMKLKHGVDTIFLDSLEEQLSITGAMSMDEAIAIIQRNERGRQGKQRGVLVKELREEEKQRKIYETAQAPEMDPDIAAANIQRIFRGYYSRAMATKERDEELIFIGMKSPHTDRSLLEKKLADARLQRKTEQVENKEEYERALVDLHGVVAVEEGPFMKEKMLEERRKWITDVMATGQLPENLDAYYAALNGDDNAAKAQAKEAEEAAAAAAVAKKGKKDEKGKKGKEDRKAGKGDKKGAKGKGGDDEEEEAPEKPPPLTGPSELCTKLATAVGQYEKVWLEKEELDNFYQKYDVALAKDVVRGPVEVQVRQQVDEMLVLQLVNIKAQLEAAAASGKKGKKGKKGRKKGGKKGGKKGKKSDKKKGKALPGDKIAELKGRAPDSFLSILVEQKVVHTSRHPFRIHDFIGSFNYLGTVHQNSDRRDRFGNWVPQDPSAAQLRQNLTEYAILPLGSAVVRAKTPHVRSIMLYGPKGSGKTMLVSAIANETGALVLNLSPSNLVGKFTGKTGPTKLVHMTFLLAKVAAIQPVLIYIDECEQVFAGGGGKKSKASADGPSRFKKDLITYLKAAMNPLDRVLIIGTTSDPGAGEVKDYRAFFDKFLHVPYPDYASRVLLWKHSLDETVKKHTESLCIKARLQRDELDISTLAHISEGYSSGSIVKAVENTLTPRRVECLEKRHLKEEEFIGALSRHTATFTDDHEKFKAFTAVITGLKETREKIRKAVEDALNPDDKKGDKGKGKGGTKKSKNLHTLSIATCTQEGAQIGNDSKKQPQHLAIMSALHALRGRIGGGGDNNNASSSVPGKFTAVSRDARQEWISERLEERKKQWLKGEEETCLDIKQSHQRLWSPFVHEVARTHELNIAWKRDLGFFTWDRVLGLEGLAALRITGHNLTTLPNALAYSLSSLTVLSLIANNLEILPENIGDLHLLTEIDLTKNQLRRLPNSITALSCLRFLNLSSNLLEELPENFGDLVLLDKLWVENNKLTALPVSIGRSRARIANFNTNSLTELPDAIGEMQNLTSLSLNMNRLKEFPESISLLPKLEVLHTSQNQIVQLPHNIGALQTLRELRLDWNCVKQLPFSFRLLKQLKVLCMEKNPLRLPPIEYVIKGVPATLAFMERSLEEFTRNARRKVIERLQEVLHFAMELMAKAQGQSDFNNISLAEKGDNPQRGGGAIDEDLNTILSLFEPNCERVVPNGDEKLAFFAVVWEEFYTTLLPALERKKAQTDSEHPSFKFDTFSVDEVEDALAKYNDDFGVASTKDFGEFRKCCCIDAFEWNQHGVRKRKVCIPGQVPYRCRRQALLVRMQMMTHEEAKDQLASTYLKKKIERLVVKTKRKCIEYINSEAGVEHFEHLAHELAKKLCLKRKRLKKLRFKHAKESEGFAKKKQKLQAKVDAFRKARDARLQDLKGKMEKLAKDKAKFENDPKRVEKIASKIRKLEKELLEKPVEDKKILELKIALEALDDAELKAVSAIDKAKVKEMNSDDEEGDGESEEEGDASSTENSGDKDSEDDSDNSSSDSDEIEVEASTDDQQPEQTSTTTTPASGGASTKFFQIDMPELKFVDYRRAATRSIERELGEEKDVNEEELVVLYQNLICGAYVTEKCERVSQKATCEFLQMRSVLKRWMGLGNRAVFEAWRDLMRENRENADKLREKFERKKQIEAQNKVLEEQLTRLEANKWVQRADMYTDAIYYEHTATGETSWYPPQYWNEEQEKLKAVASKNKVPMLKLPPI